MCRLVKLLTAELTLQRNKAGLKTDVYVSLSGCVSALQDEACVCQAVNMD